jgi:hypothetical protein
MGAYFGKPFFLEPDPFENLQLRQQRMRTPRLREPPHQHGVAGFEEEQFDRVTEIFDALKDAGEVGEEHAFSDVDSQRDILDFTALLVTELDKGWEEGWGQVVDAEIADVFETLQRVRFSGP